MSTRKKPRVVYMGTPDFAVPALEALYKEKYDIAAVITAPDKPAGRGMQLQYSPVKQAALSLQLPLLQPQKLKDPDFFKTYSSLQHDLNIIIAFRMLPESIWSHPPLGSINIHASLLPDYRGAAPIHWSVINGETTTGLSSFFLQHEIDTGNLIHTRQIPIYEEDNTGMLYDRMKILSADFLLETLDIISSGNHTGTPQPIKHDLKQAPKLNKENTEIHWGAKVFEIYNLVRGLNPFPVAWTHLFDKYVRVFNVKPFPCNHSNAVGHVETDGKNYIHVYAGDGYVSIEEAQFEGKKRLPVKEILQGLKL